MLLLRHSGGLLLCAAAAAAAATSQPPPPPIAKPGWAGQMPAYFAPAYLASGLWGVRVAPSALVRPGSRPNCSSTAWGFVRLTTSCLVGGYVYNEQPGGIQMDGQAAG